MIDKITKTITGLFGSRTERNIKPMRPIVENINKFYAQFDSLSDDQLRNKTVEFRQKIVQAISPIDEEMKNLEKEVEYNPTMEHDKKLDVFLNIDKLGKKSNEKLEEVLNDILPEAFAVVKQAAKRFSENKEIIVTATDRDKENAVNRNRDFVEIRDDKAVFFNKWTMADIETVWNMVHYDVQLIGGIVLHQGKIAEMATGEGKTLVSTLPSYLNALPQKGVHIVTVNDYLARRDAEWNGPILEFLGVSVDCIEYSKPHTQERKEAYLADVTYGTNNEFGFDYLRDNMATSKDEIVQRKHHYAMVDEVDSVLIDDARTPLIISGPTSGADKDQEKFQELKPRIQKLINAQKAYVQKAIVTIKKELSGKEQKQYPKETEETAKLLLRAYRGLPKNRALIKFLSEPGIKTYLQKVESFYLAEKEKNMHIIDEELFFTIDEKNNSVELAEKGVDLITGNGEDTNFFILPDIAEEIANIERLEITDEDKIIKKDQLLNEFAVKSERIHIVNQLVKAYTMFEQDQEYIIDEGKIKIVDEQTGRILDGRRYSDGLHQAIEAKENVKVEKSTQTYATVTLQNFFRMYHKLSGMTGTAETEAGEFWEIYKLDVIVIPTNKPIIRQDREDLIYKTVKDKYNAVIENIIENQQAQRPVLVGTTSVEISELLSKMLNRRKIKHNVLNAKQHQREADVVAEAGKAGAVTIATNMAGRGTDIKLGEGVKNVGGLAIIGTERHDSRRVDRQLRGRSGRQGDPGSSQFFVSLEDELMRLFGSGRISKIMDRLGLKEGEVIQHSMISRSIERAQKKVEENNFGSRKRTLEYDDVLNQQRQVIYARRRNALYGDRLDVDLDNMLDSFVDELIHTHLETQDFESLKQDVLRYFAMQLQITETQFLQESPKVLIEKLYQQAKEVYVRKTNNIAIRAFPVIEEIYKERRKTVENVVVPFTDGRNTTYFKVNLQEAYDTKAKQIIKEYEKISILELIDENWKEHLRELDDLRQSVQNQSYAQKDPILIYKMDAFDLFRGMLTKISSKIFPKLYKGDIQTTDSNEVENVRVPVKQTNMSNLQTSRDGSYYENNRNAAEQAGEKKEKITVRRTERKVGRNEPCPCGSGKKYKNCHGKI